MEFDAERLPLHDKNAHFNVDRVGLRGLARPMAYTLSRGNKRGLDRGAPWPTTPTCRLLGEQRRRPSHPARSAEVGHTRRVVGARAGFQGSELVTRATAKCPSRRHLAADHFKRSVLEHNGDQIRGDWHLDYGYWYKNGCLLPDMLSVAIAISPQTAEIGALRPMKGSHHCGRPEHFIYGGQTGADVERVEKLEARLETVTFEAEPGDAVFFHSNTLHSSSPNTTTSARDVLSAASTRRPTSRSSSITIRDTPRSTSFTTSRFDTSGS